jgi:Flp pilus assembly protein TadD
MSAQRAFWFIAASSAVVAIGAFGLREIVSGRANLPVPSNRIERDRVVSEMMEALDFDPRVRQKETQRLVTMAAAFSGEPGLTNAETLYALGLLKYYGDFDTEAARDAFERARRAKPTWVWPVNGLAIIEFVSGERDAALQLFAEALRLAPEWSRPHADLAILQRRAGEMGEALRHAELALEIEPDHPINHYNYAVILDELGRREDAREQYSAALAVAPDMPQANYNLACSFAREGDALGAATPLARAIELEPAFIDEAQTDPDFDPIRESPEYREVMSQAGALEP